MREASIARPAKTAQLSPPVLKDLFLKSKPTQTKDKILETVSVEPWMPGRGSVGVQLQVTW
jgi:hypothetical protein